MPPNRARGFTLLEVIAALAILGIAVGVMMQIFSGGLKNIHRIDMAHRAMHHAENVMNQVLSDQDIREPIRLSEDLDEEFSYVAEVDYWEEPEAILPLDEVTTPAYLLSVQVDVVFRNDPHGKLYRTLCLKTVSNEIGGPGVTSGDAIRQLFGGAVSGAGAASEEVLRRLGTSNPGLGGNSGQPPLGNLPLGR